MLSQGADPKKVLDGAYNVVKKSQPTYAPVFLACGYNDRPDISRGLAEVYLRFKELNVPAELHIYSEAGHGFGVRASTKGAVAGWLTRFQEWLDDRGFLRGK